MTIPLTVGGWGEVSLFSSEMKGKAAFSAWVPTSWWTLKAKHTTTNNKKHPKTNPQWPCLNNLCPLVLPGPLRAMRIGKFSYLGVGRIAAFCPIVEC